MCCVHIKAHSFSNQRRQQEKPKKQKISTPIFKATMAQSTANFAYHDFDPFYEWSEDEGSATLIVMLPGFVKEQLKVQVTSSLMLRIHGERQILENKRRRFAKEFSIPQHCDTSDVRAKFEGGVLSIKFTKLISPAPVPQKKENESEQVDNINDKQESPQKEKEPKSDEKEENNKTQEWSAPKENEPIRDEKTEEVAPQKKVGVAEVAHGTTPKARITQRLKTRVLDFTVSLRSVEDPHVKQGFGGSKCAKLIKKPKIWINIIVSILLVMVLGLYVKNAFRSSHAGSDFKEF